MKRILDAKYEVVAPEDIVAACDHLKEEEKEKIWTLLKKYKDLFDGTLGTWKGGALGIELKEGAKFYHARAFPIPNCREQQLKTEISRLCQLGVLEKVNHSEWASTSLHYP